jgi:hypothetical protein
MACRDPARVAGFSPPSGEFGGKSVADSRAPNRTGWTGGRSQNAYSFQADEAAYIRPRGVKAPACFLQLDLRGFLTIFTG